jgi:hypothetical protein
MVKYELDSDKAYGVRLSVISNNKEYIKVLEIIFHSFIENIFSSIQNIYYFNDKNLKFKIHFYVKAQTVDKDTVLEKHFLWHEKSEKELEKLMNTNNIEFLDKEFLK